ncbi:MAG: hypothetical protein ABR551_11870 [Gemmatimonadales bacterium]
MWICLNDSFLSIVAHRDEPDSLLVRARLEGHLEAIFPGVDVARTPDADFAFRAVVPREVVAEAIRRRVADIAYPNFKASVHSQALHDAYMAFWTVMHSLQRQLLARP